MKSNMSIQIKRPDTDCHAAERRAAECNTAANQFPGGKPTYFIFFIYLMLFLTIRRLFTLNRVSMTTQANELL